MTGRRLAAGAAAIAALLAVPAATAQGTRGAEMPRYEANQRLRTAMEGTCRSDEVMKGAWCVRKCAPDFRLDVAARPPACVGLKHGAKAQPPKPAYRPPDKPRRAGAEGS